jgi:cytochrome c peroxidase
MKTTTLLFSFIFLFITSKQTLQLNNNNATVEEISKAYNTHFVAFQDEVNALVQISTNNVTELNLQKQITKTRLAYKKVEYIFAYNNTNFSNTFINGAPLTKFDEDFTGGNILEPNGLQTLDEVIFGEKVLENLKEIHTLALDLKERVNQIAAADVPLQTNQQAIIEAQRSGIIRIFTLGLTGFDTPGSLNAIEESLVSLETMHHDFLFYELTLEPKAKEKFNEVNEIYRKGIKILKKHTDFNDFDRMSFLKEIVNPLYKELLEFQIVNNIKVERFKFHAQNYMSKNIVSEDFLDTNYYAYFTYLPLENSGSIALGKALFNDPTLSKSGTMSCVSCHDPKKGFADGLARSPTNNSKIVTDRNSPTVINAGYSTRYFWDMRAFDLEKQVGHVVDNTGEFNTTFDEISQKLRRNPKYVEMFKNVYHGIDKQDINPRSISNAIAAYVNSLKSFNSDFDKYVRGEIDNYPEEAIRGFNIFAGKAACATCHFTPVFNGSVPPFYTDSESEVLGITIGFDSINPQKDMDLGRFANGIPQDKKPFYKNSFKTVTLRNIELTAPYMHNGSFNTLEEVIDFYNLGGGAGMGLDMENQTLPAAPLELTKKEKEDLISFLKTLTDANYVEN